MSSRFVAPSLIAALLLASCSGGGGSSNVPGTQQQSAPVGGSTTANGKIVIDLPQATTSSNARRPAFVSTATRHASLFINHDTIADGVTPSCTSTSCTISWDTGLPTLPGTYAFAVELDDGSTACGGKACVLGEASSGYQLVSGFNGTLSPPIVINPVAAAASALDANIASNAVTEDFQITDADGVDITWAPGPPYAQFDNGPLTAVVLSITGSATLSQLGDSVFPLEYPDATGIYSPSAACAPPYGEFEIGFNPATPSGDLTPAELSSQNVAYPGTLTVTGDTFACDSGGNISVYSSGNLDVESTTRKT